MRSGETEPMTTIREFIAALEKLAPLDFAGDWDNVGVLIAPTDGNERVTGVCLTIDLRESVLDEALTAGANLIVTYHPVLFGGTKQLRRDRYADRVLLRAIQNNVTIYSPHTALDAVSGGVNDWLLACVGDVKDAHVIEPAAKDPAQGMGRVGTLRAATALSSIIERLKQTLNVPHLRIAPAHNLPVESLTITRVAVCPGAGGSVVAHARGHDLVVTGEMRHHDVLSLQSRGITTILTEHTNCERGYLPILAAQLQAVCTNVTVQVSQNDKDPLSVV